ncbi:MAG: excisionase [Pseudohongiella sp.]|nr:excisionase [Pseudohongiella sp.]
MTGYSTDAQDAKRKRGIWEEGVIWIKAPDGRILYNWKAYDAWVEG